jgi:predicted DNA-binding protein YlxM (UPF0122 family)
MNTVDVSRIKALYWKENLPAKEIAKELRVSLWSLYDFMKRNSIPRRSYSEANYLVNKDKPAFRIKEALNDREQELKIAGIMLYWAEGTLKGATVDFANSNPEMIKVFLKFLRNVCGVDERRLRVYLYCHSYCDVVRLKVYWHKLTRIPLGQFTKPYIREGSTNLSKRKLLYGLVHIRYNDKKLLDVIRDWINEYVKKVVRYHSGQMDQTVKNAASRRNSGWKSG